MINHEPSLTLALDDECRTQCRISVETRTNAYRCGTGDYPEEQLSVYLTARQYGSLRPGTTYVSTLATLARCARKWLTPTWSTMCCSARADDRSEIVRESATPHQSHIRDCMSVSFSEFAGSVGIETAFSVLAAARRWKATGKRVIELEIGDSPVSGHARSQRVGHRRYRGGRVALLRALDRAW